MSYQLSEADKETIRRDVLAEFKEKAEMKKQLGGWVNTDKLFKKRVAEREHKAKIAALKAKGELTFKDLFRFA